MTKQPTDRIDFFEPRGFAGFDEPVMDRRKPMFFVGIQRDIGAPQVVGHSLLQRMRVIVVAPHDLKQNLFNERYEEAEFLPEVLPRLPLPLDLPRHVSRQLRVVTGEILRDENGELWEKVGRRIRRLRQLASDAHGEIIDVPEFAELPATRSHTRITTAQVAEGEKHTANATLEVESVPEPPTVALRRLLPELGQWCVVCFGSFKQMLAPQLAHPERLRDLHRLPCHVQVYEATAPQKFEAVVKKVCGDNASLTDIRPLTHTVVMQLQLAPLLPAPARVPASPHREPGFVLAGERVFRLQLASDPTADEPQRKSFEPSAVGQACDPARAPTALKTTIPGCFLKPWEFKASREEALYDLSCACTFWGKLRSKLRRVVHCLAFRRDLRKWQMLLSGRSIDEQLWSVRPPHGGLTHPFVRSWAKNAIDLGRYDPRNMLTEWQIFWRRKGE